jgi:3-deoxy-D-manno-octulosonic-acid transferase
MIALYRFTTFLLPLVFRIGSLWNKKLRKGFHGRNQTIHSLKTFTKTNPDVIWFHCASLGEYEQAKPLIEIWKNKQPGIKIAVTFFSPSGYEQIANKNEADWVAYLPFDSKKNAEQFIQLLNPKLVYFIKYEFWYYFINALSSKKIPCYLVSARFNNQQRILNFPLKYFYKTLLSKFDHMFLQDKQSSEVLNRIGLTNHSYAGDTRIDRVIETKETPFEDKLVQQFCQHRFVLILGSSWEKEENTALELLSKSDLNLIIAPHEINRSTEIFEKFKHYNPVLHKTDSAIDIHESRVLIINHVGILSKLYRYGHAAFVGGGFSGQLHNILEPASYGIPVFFGPKFHKFPEAAEMIHSGMAFSITNAGMLSDALNKTKLNSNFQHLSKQWLEENKGVSLRIFEKTAGKDFSDK